MSYTTPVSEYKCLAHIANQTNATTTMQVLSALTVALKAATAYAFELVLFVEESVAADGIKVDFGGGTATLIGFRAHGLIADTALLTATPSAAVGTDFVAATVTGQAVVRITGTFYCSVAGTFQVRFAQNVHTTGTLTVYAGSNIRIGEELVT